MEAIFFEGSDGGKIVRKPIPDDLQELADEKRAFLIESLADVDDEIAEIEKLILSRQESIKSLFTNHPLDELAPLSLKLQEMSVQDGKIVEQASTLKGLFSQKIISLKKTKKAVKSYSQF